MMGFKDWAAALWAVVVTSARVLVGRVRAALSPFRTEGHAAGRTFTLPKKPRPWLRNAGKAAAGLLVSIVVGAAIGGAVVTGVRPLKDRVVSLESRMALQVKIAETQEELLEAHRALIMSMGERAAENEIRMAAMAAALARLEAPRGATVAKAVALAQRTAPARPVSKAK